LPERRYGSLRFLASSCVAAAWITLIVSIVLGFSMLAAPAPTPGLPMGTRPDLDPGGLGGLGGGGLGGGAGGIGALMPLLAGPLRMIGAISTIGGGVLSFFFLAALGQAIIVLLDMEENTRITAQAMAHMARRIGGG
jgi:hypothetical protein